MSIGVDAEVVRQEKGHDHELAPPAEDRASARDKELSAPQSPKVESEGQKQFGLALSGGGIRSATFNLGVLQGLDTLDVLKQFGFLSTVSGGGYVGSFWTAWRNRNDEFFPRKPTSGLEHPAVRHLREFSNFLSPRLGLFSFDTGRMIVAVLSGMIPSLAAALSVIVLVLLAWAAIASLAFLPVVRGGIDPATYTKIISVATIVVLPALGLTAAEWNWRRHEKAPGKVGVYVGVIAVLLAAVGVVWWTVAIPALIGALGVFDAANLTDVLRQLTREDAPISAYARPSLTWRYLLAPSLIWALGAAMCFLIRFVTARFDVNRLRGLRGALDRVAARLLFVAAAWLVISGLWMLGISLLTRAADAGGGTRGLLAALAAIGGGASAWLQRLLSRQPNKPAGSQLMARLKPALPRLLAYVAVGALVIAMAALSVSMASLGSRGVVWLAGVTFGITIATLLFFNPSEVGLHAFYRGRLARAYLGASNPAGQGKTEEHEGDDVHLDELDETAPLHLVCCAANDLTPDDAMRTLYRGATLAVLSREGFLVGISEQRPRPWPTRRRTKEGGEVSSAPTLASAVTASAAAFNSQMGGLTMRLGPGVTFLMTALNLRLGLWLPHPRSNQTARWRRWFPGWVLYRELFGISRATGKSVHLSDGGHFENMAIYELVRRGCRYILASDCGADPDVAFDDFGNLVRRVREDFGVDIQIDLSALRPGENGLARQPMVAGDIEYPTGETGVLLLVKPSLTGGEPPDITQYKTRNAAFPHETTGDQFYDEAQWESYRRLGEFAARSSFERIKRGLSTDSPDFGAQLFARARREWLPIPPAYEQRVSRIAEGIARLDQRLLADDCRRLRQQVFKEVQELELATEGGTREDLTKLDRADLAPSLRLARDAVLFMQEVYDREDLELRYNHPLYLGVINYFARWAYAPLFRLWWPVLKTLHPQPFTRFLERTFGLAVLGDRAEEKEQVTAAVAPTHGYASLCWELERDNRLATLDPSAERWKGSPGGAPRAVALPYQLRSRYGSTSVSIQAAQLIAIVHDSAAFWLASDFYVPPGLWGVGIGESFLRHIATLRPWVRDGDPVRRHVVAVYAGGATSYAERKAAADEAGLYTAAGFRERATPTNEEIAPFMGRAGAELPSIGRSGRIEFIPAKAFRFFERTVT